MRKTTAIVVLCCFFLAPLASLAQDKWDLLRCVNYAIDNNISVRQADVQARLSALTAAQTKASQIPTLGFGMNANYNFGLSNNPTTGVLENNNFFSYGLGLQSQVSIFNFFALKNLAKGDAITAEADRQAVEKASNDIALNVAVAYLDVLQMRETANVAKLKVDLSRAQLDNTRKQVDAGKLPELNAATLESVLATDSASFIQSKANADLALLRLKALLSLDAAVPFDVESPPVESIPVLPLADLQPEVVYQEAVANLPQQKVNQLRIDAAEKYVASSKARMYPSISASGSVGTNYAGVAFPTYTVGALAPTGAKVNVSGTEYDVLAPTRIITGEATTGFGRQLRNNFGQQVGLSLNVPIFNGKSARTNWERSKLQLEQAELSKQQGDLQLKQDIYTAYTNAIAALESYNASKIAVETSQRTYEFAQKRYDIGLLSTFDLITSQNNLFQAQVQQLSTQYNYVFRMKLLEFYRGQGLSL